MQNDDLASTEANDISEKVYESSSRDHGLTLSMHQPWASLLIAGIKRFEGRKWTTTQYKFPFRLWIASTVHEPQLDEIESLQNEYKQVYQTDSIPFPKSYPISALLGWVDVIAIHTNSEFEQLRNERISYGELIENSESQYVFECSNPHELILKQSISGQHKIWNLSKEMLHSVKSSVKSVDQQWRIKLNKKQIQKQQSNNKQSKQLQQKPLQIQIKTIFAKR